MTETRPRPVAGILLFDEVEVLDFAGPYEVFSTASDEAEQPCFTVVTIAARPQVRCRGGLRLLPDVTLETCPALDVLVVPGGPGADDRTAEQETALLPFLRRQRERVGLVTSVCTGAFILGRAGLLDGRRATTHSALRDALRAEFPRITVVEDKVVDEGTIITAAGVSSGIDLALHVVQRFYDVEVRRRTALDLEGPWT